MPRLAHCTHHANAIGIVILMSSILAYASPSAKPYDDNNGLVPSANQYSGALFRLSAKWPSQPPPPLANAPWVAAIGGKTITVGNAPAYVNALKEFVRSEASHLIWHYDTWDAAANGWYNQPWLGSIREATHGMYTGSTFDPSLFPGTGLKKTFTTYVLTFYDDRAARTLNRVWGTSAMTPLLTSDSAQFDEGAIIVKAAFIDITGGDWPVMKGAAEWPLYVPIPTKAAPQPPAITKSAFMQFDIIVKDSHSAPKTGWVFSTLVYDVAAPGQGWDKMVPLGAMWGNDPNVDSSANAHTRHFRRLG